MVWILKGTQMYNCYNHFNWKPHITASLKSQEQLQFYTKSPYEICNQGYLNKKRLASSTNHVQNVRSYQERTCSELMWGETTEQAKGVQRGCCSNNN